MKSKNLIIVIIIVVVVAAGGFFGGMQYQKSTQGSLALQRQGGAAGGFRQRFGGAGGAAGANVQGVRGQIVSSDSGTMTVKMTDGSTKLVILSGKTNIMKATTGSQSDLATGQQVMVFGSSNSDGSVTAQSVQLNPMGGFGAGRARPSGGPNPTQ